MLSVHASCRGKRPFSVFPFFSPSSWRRTRAFSCFRSRRRTSWATTRLGAPAPADVRGFLLLASGADVRHQAIQGFLDDLPDRKLDQFAPLRGILGSTGCLLLPPAPTGELGFRVQARVHPVSLSSKSRTSSFSAKTSLHVGEE